MIAGIDLWQKNGLHTQNDSFPSKWNAPRAFSPLLLGLQEKKSFKPHYCGYTHFAIHKVIFSQNRQ